MVKFTFVTILFVIVALFSVPSLQRGNLSVDNIYPGSEDFITIDKMESNNAEITSTSADTVLFDHFDRADISVERGLELHGSFVNIAGNNGVTFNSDDTVEFSAGNNVNVNAESMSFTSGNDVVINSDIGRVQYIAGGLFSTTAQEISVQSDVGGIAINSVGGPITLDSNTGDVNIGSKDVVNIHSTQDIDITAARSFTFNSVLGYLDVISVHEVEFNSENSMVIEAQNQRVGFNAGNFLKVNTNAFNANGDGDFTVRSFTHSLDFTSYDYTNVLSNGDVVLEADMKGIFMDAADSDINIVSSAKAVYFTSQGKGDEETGISMVSEGNIVGTFGRTSTILANSDISVLSETGAVSFTANDVLSLNTGNFYAKSDNFLVTADTKITVESNNLKVLALDRSRADSLGEINLEAQNIYYTTTQTATIHGGDTFFQAAASDLTMDADNITISATRGDNQQHYISMYGLTLTVTADDDMKLLGGEVRVHAEDNDISSNSDINIISRDVTNSEISHDSASTTTVNANDMEHKANSLLLKAGSTLAATANSITLTTNNGYGDVTITSPGTVSYVGIDGSSTFEFQGDGNYNQITLQNSNTGTWTSKGNIDFNSYNTYVSAYNLLFSANNNGSLLIYSDDFLISTPRSENSDDYIKVDTSSDISLYGNVDATGVESGLFTGVTGSFSASDSALFSSDDRESINMNVYNYTVNAATGSINILGNKITYTADDFTLSSDDLIFGADQRGINVNMDSVTLTTTNDFVSETAGDTNINSLSVIFNAVQDIFSVTSSDSSLVSDGATTLKSTGDFTTTAAGNIYFSTGDMPNPANLNISASNIYYISSLGMNITLPKGPLKINTSLSADITQTNSNNGITFGALGDFTLHASTSYDISTTNDIDFYGGDITIKAVNSIFLHDTNGFLINSTEASLAAQEVDKLTYEILFVQPVLTINSMHSTITSMSDQLQIQAFNNSAQTGTTDGNIQLIGDSIVLASDLLNQYMHFTSQGVIFITASDYIDLESTGDFNITAKNSGQFYSERVYFDTDGDLTFDATDNSCVNISSIANSLNFQVTNAPGVIEANAVFQANDFVYTQAGDGEVTITSNGKSPKRQNYDGATNGDLVFEQQVSIALRTRHEEGNIYAEAQLSTVDVTASFDIDIRSLDVANFTALGDQTYTSFGNTKVHSESGNVTMRAGHHASIHARNNNVFISTQNTTVLSEDYMLFETDTDTIITADSGDIYFNTYYQHSITLSSGDDLTFYSGASGAKFIAQGDVLSTSATVAVSGDRGINLDTNVGPILFIATTSATTTSSEETFIHSGNNVEMNADGDVTFAGLGVVLSASAADVDMTGDNIQIFTRSAIFQSLGTSTTSRDRVYFNSTDISFSAPSAYLDATELVQIGKDTLPIVSITGEGDAAVPGAIINVASSVTLTSDGLIGYYAVLGSITHTAVSGISYDAYNALTINYVDNADFRAILGSMVFNSYADITITSAGDVDYTSDHFISFIYDGTGADIQFNSDNDIFDYALQYMVTNVANTYLLTAESVYINGFENGGDHIYQTLDGDISLTAFTNMWFLSLYQLEIFTGNDWTITGANVITISTDTNGIDSSISIQSDLPQLIDITGNLALDGDYVNFYAFGNAATLVIDSPLPVFHSQFGDVVLNSTTGDISFTVTNDVTIDAAEKLVLDFLGFTGNRWNIGNDLSQSSQRGSYSSGEDFAITSDVTTLQSGLDLSFHSSEDLIFNSGSTDPLELDFEVTHGSLEINTHDVESDITFQSLTSFTIDSYALSFRAGSESKRTSVIINGDLNIDDVSTTFAASPTAVRMDSKMLFQYSTLSFDATTFNVLSAGEEAGLGGIMIGSLDPNRNVFLDIDARNDIVLLSQRADIRTWADSVVFDGDNAYINTNGLDAAVSFLMDTSIGVSTALLTVEADREVIYKATEGDFIVSDPANLNILANGPGDGDGLGVYIHAPRFVSFLSNTDILVNSFNSRYEASDDISISAGISATFTASSYLGILAQGGALTDDAGFRYYPVNGQPDFLGIWIESTDDTTITAPDVNFYSSLFNTETRILTVDAGGVIAFASSEDFQVIAEDADFTATAGEMIFTTYGGALFVTRGNTWTADNVLISAANSVPDGLLQISGDESAITFSAIAIASTSTNVLMQSADSYSLTSTGTGRYLARRGDILFRATTIERPIDFNNLGNDLSFEATDEINLYAGRSIWHRQHFTLGFFDPDFYSFNRNDPYQRGSKRYQADRDGDIYDCFCGGGPNDCDEACFLSATRTSQMWWAFWQYGLLYYPTPFNSRNWYENTI